MKFSKLLTRSILFLFHFLFLFVPLVFTSVNDELFEFNKMLAVYTIAIAVGGLYVIKCVWDKKIYWRRTPLDLPIALFFVSQLISSLFSINIHTSLFGYYSRFNGGLFSVISYIFLYYMFCIFVKRSQLKYYLTTLLLGGVFGALYAYPEHFGHSPSCLLFTQKFDVTCWVQDVKSRVFGTFGQPNWLAAYLGMLLPLAIVNVNRPEHSIKLLEDDTPALLIKQMVRFGVVLLFMSVLFFTGSRSGLAGVAIGLLLLSGIVAIIYFYRKLDLIQHFFVLLALCLGTLVLMTLVFPNPIREKLAAKLFAHPTVVAPTLLTPTGTQLEAGGSESGQIRNVVWQGALRVWQRYPIFGSGVETFAYSYYKDRLPAHNLLSEWDFLYNKAHNEFLNFLATTGLVGLLTYLLLLIGMIVYPLLVAKKILMQKTKTPEETQEHLHRSLLLIALSIGLVTLSISNFFGFSTVMVSALLYLFPAFAFVMGSEEHDAKQANKEVETTTTQWLIMFAVFASCAILFSYLVRMWTADVAYARGKQYNNLRLYTQAQPLLRSARDTMPEEPVFHDEYSSNLAQLAVMFAQAQDATQSSQAANEALKESDATLSLNDVHTNFWKTRVKVYLTLAQLDPSFYTRAQEALNQARALSPTDPKLVYYLALLAEAKKDTTSQVSLLETAIALKPNYEEARMSLAKYYETTNEKQKALEQYQYMIKFINPQNKFASDKVASLSAHLK